MKYSVAGLGMMALLCACASGPAGHPGGPEGGPPPQRSEIFVSPYGELFVSGPGEPYPVAAWFADADADGDGRLTAEEFAADGRRWFGTLDQDGDGVVGPSEIFAYERLVDSTFAAIGGGMGGAPGGGRGAGRRGPPGGGQMNLNGDQQDPMGGMGGQQGGMGGGQEGAAAPSKPRAQPYRGGTERLARAGLLSVPQPVRAADRNADQKITPEEWTATGERWFVLLDQDHDGMLTLESLPKTAVQGGRGQMRGGGRPPR
ncbi:MAG: hypothetical protein ACK4OJ_00035 [Brevundimonas sp.]